MKVQKDIQIPLSDGSVLFANLFSPDQTGTYPVMISFGVYGKDIHFEDGFNPQWLKLKEIYPELDQNGSSGEFLRWEVPDPERWIPDGYVLLVVDSRGSGKSPGYLDIYSPRETQDYYEAIEWAGTQSWSNGKVGLIGVSYLAIKQWQVAALNPPHLAAIIPWEGAADHYRDTLRHGGILSNTFTEAWWPRQVLMNQCGNGETIHRDRQTQRRTTGEPLSTLALKGNRNDYPREMVQREFWDEWFQDKSPRLARIQVPILSAANWGGPGMHLRGNFTGFMEAGSKDKWLFAHIGTHYESFYLPQYVEIQKQFFDRYLKGINNQWERRSPVQLAIRDVHGGAKIRTENEWPLARTAWTSYLLDASSLSMSDKESGGNAAVSFEALGDGLDFRLPAFERETEFTGPASLKIWVSSSTEDVDLFVTLRCFAPSGDEVTFIGAHERVPVANGWLRASHRKLNDKKSLPYQPYHSHDEKQPLRPNAVYELHVEILPTSLVFPAGYQLVLTLTGKDFVVAPPGRILHNHPLDRPPEIFGGTTTIHTGPDYPSRLLMPLISGGA